MRRSNLTITDLMDEHVGADPGTKVLVAVDGFSEPGRVQRLRGVPRALAAAAIASAMAGHDEFEDPEQAAATYLDEIALIDEGRLVRREEHALLPFPAAARITGPRSIRYHLDDEP